MPQRPRGRSDAPDLAVLEAAFDAVVGIGADDRIERWNAGAARVFGFTAEQAIGRPVRDLLVPVDRRDDYVRARARWNAGERKPFLHQRRELRALARDGSELPVEVVLTDAVGAPGGVVALIRDLSEVERADRRWRETLDRLGRAEEAASVGVWTLELPGGEAIWSEGVYRVLGLDPSTTAPGSSAFLDAVHPSDRDRAIAQIESLIHDPLGRPDVAFAVRITCGDGTTRILESKGELELDAQGAPARWVGTVHDVTAERLHERELRARDAVAGALGAWGSFEEGAGGLMAGLGRALECDVGALWTRQAGSERLECRSFWSRDGLDATAFGRCVRAATVGTGQGVAGIPWKTEQPLVSEGVEDICPDCRELGVALGLQTGVAIPATDERGALAVLTFYSTEKVVPSESLLRTLTGIGYELGHFLARRRGELTPVGLSRRELQVLRLAAAGHTGPQIAELLFLSPSTVKTHFENIYAKLGVSDRASAVGYAVRNGLVR